MHLLLAAPHRAALALLGALAVLPGCLMFAGRHWDEARQTEIEPINSTFHRHLARDIKSRDLDAVLQAYGTETGGGIPWASEKDDHSQRTEERLRWSEPAAEESIRSRYGNLFDLFPTIERAEVRIHRIYWDHRDPRGYPADIRMIVRGTGPTGELQMLDQRSRVTIDRRGENRWVWTSEDVTMRELVRNAEPAFEVATESAGLSDVHDTTGSPFFRLIGDTLVSSGSAAGDFDCDGLEDIALLSSSWLKLYRNAGDGTFRDATAESGLPASIDIAGSGLVFFDADNDGDPDLWVSGVKGDRFYRNDGCARYADVTATAGVGPIGWSSMPVVADYDLDGFLDVYVVRMGDHEKTAPSPNWEAHNGTADSLYHNNGDGTFRDVAWAAGIRGTTWGLTGAWGDYDGDGDPDLYVGNEFGSNLFYRNEGDGTFREVGSEIGAHDRSAAMGAAWGDYDNDGNLDLFVSNMYANSRWALFHPEYPPPVPWYLSWAPRSRVDSVIEELTRGNTLLHNDGNGSFANVSDAAGIRDGQWGWGVAFLDYDNDGWLDVYTSNGMVTGAIPDDV